MLSQSHPEGAEGEGVGNTVAEGVITHRDFILGFALVVSRQSAKAPALPLQLSTLRFVLYHQGKKTGIRTELSHGRKIVGGGLLGAIKRQLRLDSTEQLVDFIRCPMEYDDYIAHLQGKGMQI